MDKAQNLYYNLYTILQATCPYDTGNMKSHITMQENEKEYIINISAPKGTYDYAIAVNEALAAKSQGRSRSVKEERNYHWIQRAIKQAGEMNAEIVEMEESV